MNILINFKQVFIMTNNSNKQSSNPRRGANIYNITLGDLSPEHSLTELKDKIQQLDQMLKRVDQRLNRYDTKLVQLKTISKKEQKKMNIGLKLFNLSDNNLSNQTY